MLAIKGGYGVSPFLEKERHMKHILSVSYDDGLLLARGRLLEQEGYQVTSAMAFKDAMAICADRGFDLFILGDSIPDKDKLKLIEAFRNRCAAPVLSIWKHKQQTVDAANYLVFSDNSEELLRSVATILSRAEPSGDRIPATE
jgi:DNA-binding response OmpR family regulator